MARSVIDPVTRIEGHLRVEMEVENGVVSDAWVSGGCFRGMELVVKDRTPEDAAHIVQRICGVCPVSHSHAATIAAEKAYGITISNNARIIRNLIEGAQFLHSHILWFYTLAALDYVNPLNALKANVGSAYDLVEAAGTSCQSDLKALQERLTKFAENGQLSIFSGNWWKNGQSDTEFKLPAELDLIATAHYIEALTMQSKASEVCALLGGKMPHVMTIVPGGTSFVPTEEKLDDLWSLVHELRDWIKATIIPDTKAIAPYYKEALSFGKGCGRYVAWGVFERPSFALADRYLPSGVIDENLKLSEVDTDLIKEYIGHSWYVGDSDLNPREGVTEPEFTEYYKAGTLREENGHEIGDINDRYSWSKAPSYDGKCMEAECKVEWVDELIEAVKGGDSEYFRTPETITGEGMGLWEAPRGALLHTEKVNNGKITDYQIIIPTTWNIAPRNAEGVQGPMEQALIGTPVADVDMPINALRTVHSFDPCTACAVHVTEPSTGKHFETVTSPWGVK